MSLGTIKMQRINERVTKVISCVKTKPHFLATVGLYRFSKRPFQYLTFSISQETFPEKFAKAEQECLTICLPHTKSLKKDVILDDLFFDHHILRLHDEGWYRGTNPSSPLIGNVQLLINFRTVLFIIN